MKYTLDRRSYPLGGWPVLSEQDQSTTLWPQKYYNSQINDWMSCVYVTIAASLADPSTHWDAVSELWVAMLLAAPYGNIAWAIVLNMATAEEGQISQGQLKACVALLASRQTSVAVHLPLSCLSIQIQGRPIRKWKYLNDLEMEGLSGKTNHTHTHTVRFALQQLRIWRLCTD